MRKIKAVAVGILTMALCVNMGAMETMAKKTEAKVIQNNSTIQRDYVNLSMKQSTDQSEMTDSQGLIYAPLRDDEGGIVDENLLQVSAGELTTGNVVIPDTFQEKKVVAVAWNGFSRCEKLTGITLGGNVKEIQDYAFNGCKELSQVNLDGGSLKSIGQYAFEECESLKELILPESLIGIYSGAFSSSGLKEIVLPSKVRYINDNVFKECKELKKVTLNEEIIELDRYCFKNCVKLKEIVLPESLEIIKEKAFAGCKKLKNIELQSELKEIGPKAFHKTPFLKQQKEGKYCIVNGLIIETYGEITGNLSINGKQKINGKKIRGISGTAYSDNQKLKNITIKNIDGITGSAFKNCKADSCKIQNVDEISYYAFYDGKINTLKVKNIEKLGESFETLKGKEYYASDIGEFGISGIPRNVQKIVIDGIEKEDTIPDIHKQKKLKKAVIKGNISVIDAVNLENCPLLESLTIETPLEVEWNYTEWEDHWFEGCKKLKDVYLNVGKVNDSVEDVFPKTITLHVPKEQVKTYKKYVDCKVVAW